MCHNIETGKLLFCWFRNAYFLYVSLIPFNNSHADDRRVSEMKITGILTDGKLVGNYIVVHCRWSGDQMFG
jgi:hypothetical protein